MNATRTKRGREGLRVGYDLMVREEKISEEKEKEKVAYR